VFKGTNDSELSWPFNQRFHIKLSSKTKSKKQVEWYIPPLDCKYSTVNRPLQDEQQVTEMFGGFDMEELVELDEIFLDVYLV